MDKEILIADENPHIASSQLDYAMPRNAMQWEEDTILPDIHFADDMKHGNAQLSEAVSHAHPAYEESPFAEVSTTQTQPVSYSWHAQLRKLPILHIGWNVKFAALCVVIACTMYLGLQSATSAVASNPPATIQYDQVASINDEPVDATMDSIMEPLSDKVVSLETFIRQDRNATKVAR